MLILAVIFDMDGLMLDTEPLYRVTWKRASAECGFELTDEIYKQLVGRSRNDGFQTLVKTFGAQFSLKDFQHNVEKYEASTFSNSLISQKPGLETLLAFIEARHLSKAVATSTQRDRAMRMLKAAGLLEKFEVVATGDDVQRGKPFPDIFLLAAHRLKVAPGDCLVLEDSESGVVAAHRAGMQVYMVPDLVEPSKQTIRLADGVFESLRDVTKNLELATRSSPAMLIDLPSLRTRRLSAFPLTRRDGPELADMHRNSFVMATLGGVKSDDKATQWMVDNLAHWDRHGFGIWIFHDACDGHFVGRGGLREVEVEASREVELGYALVDKYWGMGFATEMGREILKIGLERFQLKRIIALIAAENSRSLRVAEKLGFHFEREVIWKGLPTGLYRLENKD